MTDGELIEQALSDSILVVAHPDDELLWFGSVAPFVQKIVICFLNDPVNPGMAEARRNTLSDHPWRDRIVCLELDETNAFSHADWPTPSPSRFGLRIVKPRQIRAAYRLCYRKLHKRLAPIVRNAANVFTHNPWGEYGHEEHVLVHRATTSLADEHKKSIWYSNYASTWSEGLMRLYIDDTERRTVQGEVDSAVLDRIADIYKSHGTWTWYDQVDWFDSEIFVQGPLLTVTNPAAEWSFPVNWLRPTEARPRGRPQPLSRLQQIMNRIRGR